MRVCVRQRLPNAGSGNAAKRAASIAGKAVPACKAVRLVAYARTQ